MFLHLQHDFSIDSNQCHHAEGGSNSTWVLSQWPRSKTSSAIDFTLTRCLSSKIHCMYQLFNREGETLKKKKWSTILSTFSKKNKKFSSFTKAMWILCNSDEVTILCQKDIYQCLTHMRKKWEGKREKRREKFRIILTQKWKKNEYFWSWRFLKNKLGYWHTNDN